MAYKLRASDESVLICDGARVSGDVTLGRGVSVWYNAVLRGEMDTLLVLNATRLGRDIWNTLEYVGWLRKHNVKVVCLNGELSNREVGRLLRAKQTMQGGAT